MSASFAPPAALCAAQTCAFAPRVSPRPRPQRAARRRPAACVTKPERRSGGSGDGVSLQPPPFDASSSALQAGIRAVAVGKLGARPVPAEVVAGIYAELTAASRAPATAQNLDLHLLRASFLGALYVKAELSAAERGLLSWAARGRRDGEYTADEVLAAADAGGAARGTALERFARRLLAGEMLSRAEAEEVGALLYREEAEEVGVWPVKALVAHVMRVRHESAEEICGLAAAAQRTIRAGWFDGARADGARFALVAEPFDGVVTADLMTGVVCRRLGEAGLRPVMACGASGGPKYGPNVRAVGRAAGVRFCRSGRELAEGDAAGGVAVDQEDVSPGLAAWGRVRRSIVKRPSIATTEKFVDCCPGGAGMFVASAFHDGYVEKMADAAEAVGFETYVIVGRGMEGTIGVGLGEKRRVRLVVGWRGRDGYGREEVGWNVMEDGEGRGAGLKEFKGAAGVEAMADRWRLWGEGKAEGLFEMRARATVSALDKALAVLRRERADVFGGGG